MIMDNGIYIKIQS